MKNEQEQFSPQEVVTLQDVNIFHESVTILEDVNFSISKGEFVYLIGQTGSGKSSLLRTLYGDLPLRLGDATVAGFSIRGIRKKQIPLLRRKIGIVFQDFQLLTDRTIAENLFFVMRATGWKSNAKMKQRLSEVLVKVGLGSVGNKIPYQLSGGEQQRVVIARALINEPLILFADEPTGNLDPYVSGGIMELFSKINNTGTAVLMATHNYNIIRNHPGRILKCQNRTILDSNKENFALTDEW